MPTLASMDRPATKKVIVTTYEELPRRRRRPTGSHGAPTATRAKTRAPSTQGAAGGYNRRAMLLAYAQQLRRRGGGQRGGPRMLEWGKWKADRGAGNGVVGTVTWRRRSWCSRLWFWVRLWIRTFLRGVRRIGENASCKKDDRTG